LFGGIAAQIEKHLVHVQETAVGHAQDGGGVGAAIERLGEALFAHAQFLGSLADHAIQVLHPEPGLTGQDPFLRERMRQLKDLHGLKRLLEDEQVVGVAQPARHVIPRIVRVGRADDRLEFGRTLPDAFQRFDAVPARRHAHIHEGQRIGIPLVQRFLHHLQRFLALVGGVKSESDAFNR